MKVNRLVKIFTWAKQIGVHYETIRTWIKKGKLTKDKHYIVIDGMIFINLDAVEGWKVEDGREKR